MAFQTQRTFFSSQIFLSVGKSLTFQPYYFRIKKRIKGKDTNNGHIWSCSLTTLSVRMLTTHISALVIIYAESSLLPLWAMHFSHLVPFGHHKTVFSVMNFLNPGMSVKRVAIEMVTFYFLTIIWNLCKIRSFLSICLSSLCSYWH